MKFKRKKSRMHFTYLTTEERVGWVFFLVISVCFNWKEKVNLWFKVIINWFCYCVNLLTVIRNFCIQIDFTSPIPQFVVNCLFKPVKVVYSFRGILKILPNEECCYGMPILFVFLMSGRWINKKKLWVYYV